MNTVPAYAAIRDAILNAPPRAVGFPLSILRDPAQLAELRAQPHLQHLLGQVGDEMQRAMTTPIPALPFSLFQRFEHTGDRALFEKSYFDRRRRLAALALGALVYPQRTEDGDPLVALGDLLWEICGEYSWALPAHLPVSIDAIRANRLSPEQIVDLFAAETAAALAEVLSLLGDHLPPLFDLRIRQEVERRVFQPLFDNPVHFDWESEATNWAAVCAGSAGIAALVLVEDRERLAAMIDRAMRALESFLSGFPADGGTAEGIVYWEYGFGFYTYFAEALREYTGGALDLLDIPKIRKIAKFPQAVALGDNHFVNFSDANATVHLHAGLCVRLRERTGATMPPLPQPDFGTDHIFRWAHISRDVVWSRPFDGAPLATGRFYLPDLAWVIDRRVVNGQTIAFAAKGGHNDEPHNHNDLGHFILHVGGENLLADVGAGRYTRQYFGVERYASIHNGAQGHSVPVVDGVQQQAGREFSASVKHYLSRANKLEFTLDLTEAYALPSLRHLNREFHWRRNVPEADGYLLVHDYCSANEEVEFEERLISLYEPEIFKGAPDAWVRWRGRQGVVEMRYNGYVLTPELVSTPSEDHFGTSITIYTLILRTSLGAGGNIPLMFYCDLLTTATY